MVLDLLKLHFQYSTFFLPDWCVPQWSENKGLLYRGLSNKVESARLEAGSVSVWPGGSTGYGYVWLAQTDSSRSRTSDQQYGSLWDVNIICPVHSWVKSAWVTLGAGRYYNDHCGFEGHSTKNDTEFCLLVRNLPTYCVVSLPIVLWYPGQLNCLN